MGLFNHHPHHQRNASSSLASAHAHHGSVPSSQPMESHPQTPAGRSSSSSSRSVHSTHSTATLKAGQQSTLPLAYAVGRVADQQHPQQHHHHHQHQQHGTTSDIVMSDSSGGAMYVHHEHTSHSRPAPVPPARGSSLGQVESSGLMTPSSADSLPAVHLTQATPTKRKSVKRDPLGRVYHPQPDSPTLGHGSLDVHEVGLSTSEGDFTFPVPGRQAEELDSEEERAQERAKQAAAKLEKQREQGRTRQARKRARDKEKAAKASQSNTPGKPAPLSLSLGSRNASSASLAPIAVPLASAVTPPLGTSTSTSSSFYSSLPTSSSFPSLSPGNSPFSMSQHVSGTSSPNTTFSPAVTSGSGYDMANPVWSSSRTYASKSAVDIRTPPTMQAGPVPPSWRRSGKQKGGSTANVGMALDNDDVAPLTYPGGQAGTATPSTAASTAAGAAYMHSSKRRRSEPEPDLFKRAEVGLGVLDIAENEQIEYLDSPGHPHTQTHHAGGNTDTFLSVKERPGIRRTASDSAAVVLEAPAPMSSGSRSPTPPPVGSHGQSTPYMPALQPPPDSTPSNGEMFANAVAGFLISSGLEPVQQAVQGLGLTPEDVMSMKGELAACYDRWSFDRSRLEKRMRAVTLEDPRTGSRPMSAYTSMATTPLQESAPLSTTSTCSSSPSTSRLHLPLAPALPVSTGAAMQTTATSRSATSQATPKGSSKTPSRARSLSSASMRGRGFKLGGKTNTRSPIVARQPDPLVSPLSSTSFQFPNTPGHHHAVPGSDGASPLMSSVQTPNTGQSAYFNHDDIDAVTAAGFAYGVGGNNGGGHSRSATDPVGSKVYSTRSAQHGHHPGSSYAAGMDQHQSDYYHHRPSASSSGLSSPVDMSIPMHSRHTSLSSSVSTQPPPHTYSGFPGPDNMQPGHLGMQGVPGSGGMQYAPQHMMTPDSQRYHHHQPRGHHTHTSSVSPAFSASSNSPLTHMSRPSYPTANAWQPPFTPIAEQGTPTRPSPNPSSASHGMLGLPQPPRQGGLDNMVLSPNPPTAPMPLPLGSGWEVPQAQQPFQHLQHQQHQQAYSGNDPFALSSHPHPPTN